MTHARGMPRPCLFVLVHSFFSILTSLWLGCIVAVQYDRQTCTSIASHAPLAGSERAMQQHPIRGHHRAPSCVCIRRGSAWPSEKGAGRSAGARAVYRAR